MAAGWLLCTSAATAATTHKVSVIDFRVFVPNDITIAVGDTVRWTNPVSRSGSPHDVTAEDGSWASPQAESFVFEHTFNTEGEFRYYCAYHDPNDNDGTHWGIVRVTAAPAATLKINAGLSDAWYAPATAGQGFFIIVWPQSGLVFLSWFTYDTERPPADVSAIVGDPGHRWLTAQGPFAGDTADLDVYLSQGGTFDSSEPPVGAPTLVGTISITWAGCNAADLTYDLPALGLSGIIPIERVVLDRVPQCEAAQ